MMIICLSCSGVSETTKRSVHDSYIHIFIPFDESGNFISTSEYYCYIISRQELPFTNYPDNVILKIREIIKSSSRNENLRSKDEFYRGFISRIITDRNFNDYKTELLENLEGNFILSHRESSNTYHIYGNFSNNDQRKIAKDKAKNLIYLFYLQVVISGPMFFENNLNVYFSGIFMRGWFEHLIYIKETDNKTNKSLSFYISFKNYIKKKSTAHVLSYFVVVNIPLNEKSSKYKWIFDSSIINETSEMLKDICDEVFSKLSEINLSFELIKKDIKLKNNGRTFIYSYKETCFNISFYDFIDNESSFVVIFNDDNDDYLKRLTSLGRIKNSCLASGK